MADRADAAVFAPNGRLSPDGFTSAALASLGAALALTRQTRWDVVRSPHVFMGLLATPDEAVRRWAARWGADLAELLDQFLTLFQQSPGVADAPLDLTREFLSDNALRVLRLAWRRAGARRAAQVTPIDLLIVVLTADDSIVAECFERVGVVPARLAELADLAQRDDPP